jgi:hypothetical protein
MANASAPFGLRWVGSLGGGGISGQIKKFYTAHSSAIYVGDMVKLSGSAGHVNANDPYYPSIEISATSAASIGVVIGFDPLPSDLSVKYHVVTTAVPQYVYVNVDPLAIYEIQGSSATWEVTDIGQSADLTVAAGSSVTGISGSYATVTTGQTDDSLTILGFSQAPNNEIGAYAYLIVKLNLHQYANGATGV